MAKQAPKVPGEGMEAKPEPIANTPDPRVTADLKNAVDYGDPRKLTEPVLTRQGWLVPPLPKAPMA